MSGNDLTIRIPIRTLKWMGFIVFAGTALLEWWLWVFAMSETKVFDWPQSALGWTCAAIYYHALYLEHKGERGTP